MGWLFAAAWCASGAWSLYQVARLNPQAMNDDVVSSVLITFMAGPIVGAIALGEAHRKSRANPAKDTPHD